jgi:hypothetical protein
LAELVFEIAATSVMNGCDIRIPEGVRIRIRLFGPYALDLVVKDHPEYDWPYANLAD